MFLKYYRQFVFQQLSPTFNRQLSVTRPNLKSYKKFLNYSKVPKVNNYDLVIQYVRGWGPGGQSTNKTSNAVVMKHVPTGIVVKCHETRSQFKNKEIALEWLTNKLDLHYNGEDAVQNQLKRLEQRDKQEKEQKQKKRALMKAAFNEREGLD